MTVTGTAAAWASVMHLYPGIALDPGLDLAERIRGLVFGSAIGDALGGPIEFQSRERVQQLEHPPKVWQEGEKLDANARASAAARLRLRPYSPLRPGTESYGQWNHDSPPGTITDDTRHKLVLLLALHGAEARGTWPVTVHSLARAYLEWPETRAVMGKPGYEALAKDWLEEWQFAARWVLGERDLERALPPERMWQSLPTVCGQMTLLPLAAIDAGQPERAYRAAYELWFFDNGLGKDLNAAIVAGLSVALTTPLPVDGARSAFEAIFAAMRRTDPFRFGKIRWSERAVDRWLNLALRLARSAQGEPARLFDALERQFALSTKWEAQVAFVVAISCLEIADYHPLAALQLSLEWGHDSDSYAQLVGAFVGAVHGDALFPKAWAHAVESRLLADHKVDLEQECRFLSRVHEKANERKLVE
jgi:ADP-ribosylglycohydrolase